MSGSPVAASFTEPVTTFCANAAVVIRLKRKMKKYPAVGQDIFMKRSFD